jgi:hypothetical protein
VDRNVKAVAMVKERLSLFIGVTILVNFNAAYFSGKLNDAQINDESLSWQEMTAHRAKFPLILQL